MILMYPYEKKKVYRPYPVSDLIRGADLKKNTDEKYFLDHFITFDELNNYFGFKEIRNPISFLPPPPLSKILFIPCKSVENTVLKDDTIYLRGNKWMDLDRWYSGQWKGYWAPSQMSEVFDHIIDINGESSILVFFTNYLSSLVYFSFREEKENTMGLYVYVFDNVNSPERVDETLKKIENEENLVPKFAANIYKDNLLWGSLRFVYLLLEIINTTFDENIPITKFFQVLKYSFGSNLLKLKGNVIKFCNLIINYQSYRITPNINLLLKIVNKTFKRNIPKDKFSKVMKCYFNSELFKLESNITIFCKKLIKYAETSPQ